MEKFIQFITKHNIKITVITLLFPIIIQLKTIILPPIIVLYDKLPSFSQSYDAILSIRNPFHEKKITYYSNATNIIEENYSNIPKDLNWNYSREDIVNIKYLVKFLLKLQNDNYNYPDRKNNIEQKQLIKNIDKVINDIENYNFKTSNILLEKLINKSSNPKKIVQYLGFQAIITIFINPNDPIKAINIYNKALSYNKNNLFILNNFAQLYARFQNFSSAEEIYMRIIEITQNNKKQPEKLSLGYSNLGTLYLLQGNYITALKYFNIALKINKKHQLNLSMATQYNNIALSYEKQNNIKKSCINYRRARIIFYRYYQDKQAEQILNKLKELNCI